MANTVSGPRVPGSEHIPFNPINPWGRKPTVRRADGTEIDWTSPLRQPIYRVVAEDIATGKTIPIFPATQLQYADEFCAMVKRMIKQGFEKQWSNPTVVREI